jgi:4-hydroxy-tetrahydrodipicolinate reductase
MHRSQLQVVGAIDVDPAKVGRDLGEILGGESVGIPVEASLGDVVAKQPVDVVLQATGSHIPQVAGQIQEIAAAGCHIVSTCEELAYPWQRHPELAQQIDATARECGISILGTGVNPGFVMDTLVLIATAVCSDIQRIVSTRVVAARERRLALQQKIGSGMDAAEFRQLAAQDAIGHVGLRESFQLIAAGLGWDIASLEESIEPVIADKHIITEHFDIAAGQVAGNHQIIRGASQGRELVLDLTMSMAVTEGRDSVSVDANPPIELEVVGGTHGDQATWSMLANMVPRVAAARPGLLTMLDVDLPRAIG